MVELVARHQQRRPFGHLLAQALIIGGPSGGEIKEQQDRIGTGQGLQAAIDAQLLHPIVGGTNASGIEQGDRHPIEHQLAFEQIAGGAG